MKNPSLRFIRVNQNFTDWTPCALSKLLDYQRPDKFIVKSEILESGKTPVLTANKSFIIGYTNDVDSVCKVSESIIFDDFTCDFKYVNFPFKVKSSAIKILTPKDGCNLKFLEATLKNLKYAPEGHQRHWISKVQNELVYVPELEEQEKIASFFSAIDQKIALAERKLSLLKQLSIAALEYIFNKKDKRFSNETWHSKKLLDVAPLQRGFDLPSSCLKDGNIPVVYSKGISAWHNDYKVEGEGVIIGRSGSVGTVNYLSSGKYWPHNTTLWVTDFKGNNPKFIFYLYKYLNPARFATGTGVPTLNRNDLHELFVSIPSYSVQKAISENLATIDERVELAKAKLTKLQKLKQALLQQMFI